MSTTLAVGCEYAIETGEVDSRLRRQRASLAMTCMDAQER